MGGSAWLAGLRGVELAWWVIRWAVCCKILRKAQADEGGRRSGRCTSGVVGVVERWLSGLASRSSAQAVIGANFLILLCVLGDFS